MKKYNLKQQAWSARKVRDHRFRLFAWMFTFVFAVFAVYSLAMFIQGEASPLALLLTGGAGLKMAGMAVIGNIEDQTDLYTQGNQMAYEIGLVALDQIDNTVAFPTPNASREIGAVTLNSGEVAHKFFAHNIPTLNSKITKGDYTVDPTKEFNVVMANILREQILDFSEEYAGGKFLVYWRKVEETQWYMIGSYDKPATLDDIELKFDDANVAIFKFGHKSVSQFYKAVTPSWAAPTTVAADATNLAIGSSGSYQLTDNTGATAIATISGAAAADVGRLITVFGSGGTYPSTIADNSVFVLANGTTWTANAGSRISFRILDTGTLVEVERYQT